MSPARLSHYPRRDGKLPEGARWVGRTSRWGNPYRVNEHLVTLHAGHERAVESYRRFAAERLSEDPRWLEPLRDATALACACPLEMPCHVDVLLELLEEVER
ncbi:MAG: DUF4326 domain-containing protein [Microthrixaceae bacterium]|nr:DUF4326 domain-containing protein [Microthrixaceae bacterium]